jgi:hypothetical protein
VAGSYPQSEARSVIVRLRGDDVARVSAAARRMIELDRRGERMVAPSAAGGRGAG